MWMKQDQNHEHAANMGALLTTAFIFSFLIQLNFILQK